MRARAITTSTLASSMPAPLIETVLDYYSRAAAGMGQREDKLVFADDDLIRATTHTFAMRTSEGLVASWGFNTSNRLPPNLKNVKAICTARDGAFAAITGDNNQVRCWGSRAYGGDCSGVASELQQVEGICSTSGAFAALKTDGTVLTWGDATSGGNSSAVRDRLKGVKAISSTERAFAAVLHDGTVETWGMEECGGVLPPWVQERLKQVQCISITGSSYAFAALLSDGTVDTWGHKGGDCSLVADELTQVKLICASQEAFAALRKDGTVVTWGSNDDHHYHQVTAELKQVVAIGSTARAFAALKSGGGVITWGSEKHGGDSSRVAAALKEGVVAVRGTSDAFAALRRDGTVVTWGNAGSGGDSSAVQKELYEIVSISSTNYAFAARRSDGTVVTWGDKARGGDSSSIPGTVGRGTEGGFMGSIRSALRK